MKIGSSVMAPIKPSCIVKSFYENNLNIIELEYNKMFTPEEIRKIKEFDMNISIHCPFRNLRIKYSLPSLILNMPRFYFGKSYIKMMDESLIAAKKLDATCCVIHGGGLPHGYHRFKKLRNREELLKALVKDLKPFFIKSKNLGIKVLLENLMFNNIFGKTSDIKYVQDKFPWLGFCLDFAHSELTMQTDELKIFHVDHVHVSDNDLKNDLHLPVGDGKMCFFKLFDTLKNMGYKGKIISEDVNIHNAVKSVKRLEGLLKEFQKLYKQE